MRTSPFLIPILLLTAAASAHAGSATWNLNPTSGDWNIAANWTPATVPNMPADTASFGLSNRTSISTSASFGLNGMVFNPGASAYTISTTDFITISGTGIVNNSGVTQNIIAAVDKSFGDYGIIYFTNNATSGESVNYDVKGGPRDDFIGGQITFYDNSSADGGVFTTSGGLRLGASGSEIHFYDESTAAHVTLICNSGAPGAAWGAIGFGGKSLTESTVAVNGATTYFGVSALFTCDASLPLVDVTITTNGNLGTEKEFGVASSYLYGPSAQGCTFTSNGGSATGTSGGYTEFSNTFDTGDSVLIANGGTNGGNGGVLVLLDSSVVRGRVELFGNGMLVISSHDAPGASVGSLEGDGIVTMGALNLAVGSNSLSTTFSGTLQGDAGSSLTKVGTGTLTLSGANTYTGGTTISNGALFVKTKPDSGTGSGKVAANTGTLGGTGTIGGAVTVGKGNGSGAFLSPGTNGIGTLTLKDTLTFKLDGTYQFEVNSNNVKADKVIVKGVTIRSGAQFSLTDRGSGILTTGTTFTAIRNTAETPFSGAFANLLEGSTITVGSNTFQANYEGGDGNDLTLTVVP
jgi:autotransporter-associated beta strand protein